MSTELAPQEIAERRWQAYMEAAGTCLQDASTTGSEEESRCASRVLRSPATWRRWEIEFGRAIRPVTAYRTRMLQIRNLRQVGLTWVHRAAPFRHLRDARLRGEHRADLVLSLHTHATYSRAMLAEHELYLMSVCHSCCATHLGEDVLGDTLFEESMRRYQQLYMDYFRSHCAALQERDAAAIGAARALLPMLKVQLAELRQAILDHPLRAGWLQREAALRDPTGDTQRLSLLRPTR